MKSTARSELKSLTGLRGLAACWVMLGHYGLDRWAGAGWIRAFGSHSYIAVDLFMILSGFVLALTYADRFTPGAGGFRQFASHRLARIYPLYALTTAICLVLRWFDVGAAVCDPCGPSIAANFAMAQEWLWPVESFNGPGWSLSVEWGLNLLFPIFVLILLRAPMRHAALVMGGAMLGLAMFAMLRGQLTDGRPMAGAMNWYSFPSSLPRCAVDFMLGMFAWRLRAHAASNGAASNGAANDGIASDTAGWIRWLGRTPTLLAILSGLLVASFVPSLDIVFVLLSCCLVVGCSLETSWVADRLGSPLPHWLGLISYSIYMWHMTLLPVRALAINLWTGSHMSATAEVANATEAAVCVIAALGVSALSFHTFEKPAQRWLRRALDARRELSVA